MGSGNEILDMYIYETGTLLEQLETIVLEAEKVDTFSQENVNEIFRIMHTIKGSSAMMEFSSIASIAHHIEDLFFYIRDKGIDTLDSQHKKELFNLMFRSEDCLRGQVEKVESGEPLDTDFDSFAAEINSFLKKISGAGEEKAAASEPAQEKAGEPTETVPAGTSVSPESLPDDKSAVCFLHVFLDEGIGMENLRAFMIVNSLKECELEFRYYPDPPPSKSEYSQPLEEADLPPV